jgi:hypothetical protein
MGVSGGRREAAFSLAAVVVSVSVFLPWLGFDYRLDPRKSAVNDYWKARFPDVVYGRAYRPYVQRVLVPATIRLVRRALPRPVLRAIRRTVIGAPIFLPRKLGVLGWEPEYLTEYVVAIPLLFVTLLAFPYALRRLFCSLYDSSRAAFLAPILAVALLPAFFFDRGTHYLYDFASLSLFTWALACLAGRRWPAFYVAFTLGLLNKETMVLATLAFALAEWRAMPRRRLFAHVGGQVAIVAAIQAALHAAFRRNPGGSVEWHLVKNMRLLRAPPPAASIVLLACVVVLVLARFGDKPIFLRRTLVALAPLAVTALFFGVYGEIRAFYEAYAVVFLLAFDSASRAIGLPLRRITPADPTPAVCP